MRTDGEKIFNAVNTLALTVICAVTVYPYINQLAYALNNGTDSMRGGLTVLPRAPTFDNFTAVFANKEFSSALFISAARVALATLISTLTVYAAAFGLTRKGLPYRRAITVFLMFPAYISAGLIPAYILFRYLRMINNFWVYVLPSAFVFYNMVIIRSFLQEIPESIEESAKLDGANDIAVMFRIIMPMSLPVIATVALWSAVGAWNDWTTNLMFVTDKKLQTLQYLMMRLIKESDVVRRMAAEAARERGGAAGTVKVTSESVKSATLIVTTLPIIALYPFLQKYFIKGVTLGAVKE
jgi:putative aldouronate transport system permease protein